MPLIPKFKQIRSNGFQDTFCKQTDRHCSFWSIALKNKGKPTLGSEMGSLDAPHKIAYMNIPSFNSTPFSYLPYAIIY